MSCRTPSQASSSSSFTPAGSTADSIVGGKGRQRVQAAEKQTKEEGEGGKMKKCGHKEEEKCLALIVPGDAGCQTLILKRKKK